jgi:hypothetical protein
VLLELGARTGMIPRETVHHYTDMNPRGPRQRMYVGDPRETAMMNSARLALDHLGDALALCDQLSTSDPRDRGFAVLMSRLTTELTAFDESMNVVNEGVPPKFFYDVMRPFFDEIEVGGVRYMGPTAGHVPLFLVDLVLWTSGEGSEDYHRYRTSGSQYTLPQWSALQYDWAERPALTRRVAEAMSEPDAPATVQASAAALAAALRVLVVFRGKHVTYARKAYAEEDQEHGGSGGGSIGLLQEILDLTRQNANLVREATGIRVISA